MDLELFTSSFAFTFGVFAYSTSLSQITCVPEIMMIASKKAANLSKKDLASPSPSIEYFKPPLYLASIIAFIFKILFGVTGAMSLDNDDYNIFSNILYSKHINEGVLLTLTAFVGFVIIPGAIE